MSKVYNKNVITRKNEERNKKKEVFKNLLTKEKEPI